MLQESAKPAFDGQGIPEEPTVVKIGDNRIFEKTGAFIRILPHVPKHDPYLLNGTNPDLAEQALTIPVEGTLEEIKTAIQNHFSEDLTFDPSIIIYGATGSKWSMRITGGALSTRDQVIKEVASMLAQADANNALDKVVKPETTYTP